ncbi:MAG: DUF624 domain-containing protein [Chloroflexi bacterium]|nr:DUF624 domain-containing protein [Chloroflexota bacterium]
MKNVFRVFWEALKDLWDELFLLILMNIVTVLLVIPVVTLPPALAGLWNVANRVAQGKVIGWSDYFAGFRRYFWKAWGLALLNILVLIIVSTNLWFYVPGNTPFDLHPTLSLLLRPAWAAVAFLWLAAQMYPLALLLEQEDQRLRVAWRNTAVIFIANPGFTLALAVLLLIVIVISTLLPMMWFLVTPALFAVVCSKAVRHLLVPHRPEAGQS